MLTFKLTYNTFASMFGDVLTNLERSKGVLMQTVSLAHFQESQEARLRFTEEFNAQKERERHYRLLAVVDWLSADKSSEIQQMDLDEKRASYPTTARWIFTNPLMRQWLERTDPTKPIFWLSGIPGAGSSGSP
jgi:hypothetical protein